MYVNDADKPVSVRPVWQIQQPVRGQLLSAVLLAALGAILALAPLAGIAHIGHFVLQDTKPVSMSSMRHDIAWSLGLSPLSMFAGLTFIFGSELVAHLADNLLTSQLPQAWFNDRSSGEIKQTEAECVFPVASVNALPLPGPCLRALLSCC